MADSIKDRWTCCPSCDEIHVKGEAHICFGKRMRDRIYRWSIWTDCTYLVLFGRWPIRVR